jgi:hypothetical protein
MSAPWLAIAFLAGAWPRRRAHAAAMGLLVTLAAVAGYLGMTLSPLEGVATDSIPLVLRGPLSDARHPSRARHGPGVWLARRILALQPIHADRRC